VCHSRNSDASVARALDVLRLQEPKGGLTVRVPAFPEIMTFADDETEALALAKEAIELAIEDRTARGEPIPAQDAMWLHSVALAA